MRNLLLKSVFAAVVLLAFSYGAVVNKDEGSKPPVENGLEWFKSYIDKVVKGDVKDENRDLSYDEKDLDSNPNGRELKSRLFKQRQQLKREKRAVYRYFNDSQRIAHEHELFERAYRNVFTSERFYQMYSDRAHIYKYFEKVGGRRDSLYDFGWVFGGRDSFPWQKGKVARVAQNRMVYVVTDRRTQPGLVVYDGHYNNGTEVISLMHYSTYSIFDYI